MTPVESIRGIRPVQQWKEDQKFIPKNQVNLDLRLCSGLIRDFIFCFALLDFISALKIQPQVVGFVCLFVLSCSKARDSVSRNHN